MIAVLSSALRLTPQHLRRTFLHDVTYNLFLSATKTYVRREKDGKGKGKRKKVTIANQGPRAPHLLAHLTSPTLRHSLGQEPAHCQGVA